MKKRWKILSSCFSNTVNSAYMKCENQHHFVSYNRRFHISGEKMACVFITCFQKLVSYNRRFHISGFHISGVNCIMKNLVIKKRVLLTKLSFRIKRSQYCQKSRYNKLNCPDRALQSAPDKLTSVKLTLRISYHFSQEPNLPFINTSDKLTELRLN